MALDELTTVYPKGRAARAILNRPAVLFPERSAELQDLLMGELIV